MNVDGAGEQSKLASMQNLSWIRGLAEKSIVVDDVEEKRSEEIRIHFEKNVEAANDMVVKLEREEYGQGIRWIVAKPRSHGHSEKLFMWGCACCFTLVCSPEW